MSAAPKSVTIHCKGHPNIRASHAKTFELTRDPSITAAGTCIIGVEAAYDEAALLSLRGPVRIILECGEFRDEALARINPKFAAGAPLIFRRMPTPEPRTFCVGVDKGSNALDRDLIDALQKQGAELTVTIEALDHNAAAEEAEDGILYIVGTPIGNLDDLSPRALSVLQSVDLVLCEDTRTTRSLLSGFGIEAQTTAYHDHNERDRAPDLIARLKGGARLALVSEAGMPLVSDPGFHLVRAAREEGLAVTVVPGPDAVTSALALAGLPTDDFRFLGFLPRKPTLRRQRLEEVKSVPYTSLFFEAPHRIEKTLEDAADILGDRPLALCRNITKFGEKTLTGTAATILNAIQEGEAVNGELVLVLGGAAPKEEDGTTAPDDGALQRMLESLVASGLPTKAIGDAYAKALGIPRREGFNRVLEMKKALEE